MSRKALLASPWALVIYALVVVIAIIVGWGFAASVPFIVNNQQVSSQTRLSLDAFTRVECAPHVQPTALINQYFARGVQNPQTAISLALPEGTYTITLSECASDFFEPLKNKLWIVPKNKQMENYAIVVLSPRCSNGQTCFQIGDIPADATSQDIVFVTPFNDAATLRLFIS